MESIFLTDIMQGLKYAIEQSKNLNQFALAVGVNQSTLFHWLSGHSLPTLKKVSSIMDYLGAHVVFPWTATIPSEITFETQLKELKEKIDELNEQIANYKVIMEGYQQLFKAKN